MEKLLQADRRPDVAQNLAMAYRDAGRWQEAADLLKFVYTSQPENWYAALGHAEDLLRVGRWGAGWFLHNLARPTREGAALRLGIGHDIKEWWGGPVEGTLLVINEGGAGDKICYSRFLPELTKLGIRWKLYPQKGFYEIYERLPWIGKERLVQDDEDIPDLTHWTTNFSLPGVLHTKSMGDVPKFPAYFAATKESAEKYAIKRTDDLPAIGLCWSANEAFQGGRRVRSMSEGQAMRLVSMTAHKVHWVNLQFQHKMPYPVVNSEFSSYDDTMGLIANLDAVLSVDTFVMHMAGAMGKPLGVLLSSNADWKFSTGDVCPFYPEAKLFRNGFGIGFENAIDLAVEAIRKNEFPQLSLREGSKTAQQSNLEVGVSLCQ